MKLARYFCSSSAVVFVLITFWGFTPYYLYGKAAGGNPIAPEMSVLDSIHGAAMSAWVLLFLVQAVLIGDGNRRLHMKLGWAALAIAPVLAICSILTAFRSVQSSPDFFFFAMPYPRFLLVMFTEVALYTAFVAAGPITRKRPAMHRPMMLLASLSILAGATVRIPTLYPVVSHAGWPGLFGPIFALGAVLLVIRLLLTRKLGPLPLDTRPWSPSTSSPPTLPSPRPGIALPRLCSSSDRASLRVAGCDRTGGPILIGFADEAELIPARSRLVIVVE